MKVVFEGDSVTDACRNYADETSLGVGYAFFAAESLRASFPNAVWQNVAVSGNRTCDLLERAERVAALKPDVLSILVGINDVWRRYDSGDETTLEQFEQNYRSILEIYRAKTKAKIIMLEPFLRDREENSFRPDLDPKIGVVRKLAREFASVYIPLDGLMAAAFVAKKPDHWLNDDVHPNECGARLIARFWTQAFLRIVHA